MFLTHVHRLRGLAILLIVLEHCVDFMLWDKHPETFDLCNDILENSTILFIFIAGYLFQYLAKNYAFTDYLQKKIKNVLIPYVLMAAPAVTHSIVVPNNLSPLQELEGQSLLFKITWLYTYPGSTINFALWYIPVITLFFLMAPIFVQFIKFPKLYFLLFLLIPISILAHRPSYSMDHNFQLFIYFLSAYVCGMFFSQFRDKLNQYYDRFLYLLGAGYLCLLMGHYFLSDHHGYYHVNQIFDFTHGYIDWIYFQQLVLAILLLGVMRLFNDKKMPILEYLGDISFTIFFTHLYVIYIVKWFLNFHHPEISVQSMLALFVIVISASTTFAFVAKKIFGTKSRMLTGS